jgi:uncharacterized SAM-binding protein YcdF (DUF218 family)
LAGLAFGLRLAPLPIIAGCSLVLVAAVSIPVRRRSPRVYKYCSRIITAVCVCAVAVVVVASAQILVYSFNDDAPPDAFVIVLGCGLSPTDHTAPSLMLKARLDAAYDYLTENPDALCVVSGGQGANELISEARSMFTYLTGRGIAPERIFMEAKSVSTQENLELSKAVAREHGIETSNVVIVTDGFHEYRAHYLAKTLGLVPYTRSSHTNPGLTAFFWAREIGGVVAQIWFRQIFVG